MTNEEAVKLSKYIVSANALLHQVQAELRDHITTDERKILSRTVAVATGELYAEILRPLWEEHPNLKSKATGGTATYERDVLSKLGQLANSMEIHN